MAAGNPTISTFLELRDNMSAGVRAVASEIDRLRDAAKAAEDALNRMRAAAARPSRGPGGAGGAGGGPGGRPPPGGRGAGGAGGAGRPDEMFRFTGGIFSAVTRANLLVDAIENAVVGATHAVTGLLKYTVKVGEEYEKTQLSIANTLESMGLAPTIKVAAAGAIGLIDIMREKAAKLPGETKDYVKVFALALPEAIAAGEKDLKKFANFASMYTATALSKGVDAPQAGRDLVEMLQGRAHIRTATYQKLRTQIGLLATEFNKLAPEERFTRVVEAVKKASSGMDLAADTANAKFGELKSRVDEIFLYGGKNFFESIKATVTDINGWLERNKDSVIGLATVVSTVLGDAFSGVLITLRELVGLMGSFSPVKAMTPDQMQARIKELRVRTRERAHGADFIPGYGLAQRMMEVGELSRLEGMLAKHIETQTRIKDSIKRFSGVDKAFERKFDSEKATPEAKLLLRYRQGFFNQFEELGYDSAKEAFDRYAEAQGFDEKQRFDLWQQLVQQGAVQVQRFNPVVREMRVEFNNNRFDIKQQFAEGFDPDRIAVAFASDLARAGEMKLGAVTSPTFAAQ